MTGYMARPDETNRVPPTRSTWLSLTRVPISRISAVNGGWTHHMNPHVRAWRRQLYPDITDWGAYDEACNP